MRRMDRYNDDTNKVQQSRSVKNQELYQNIGSNTRYTNFTDVTNANAYDLSQPSTNTRESYHKMREYQSIMPEPAIKKELDEFKNLYHDHENRVYDINSVLEEARKNRIEKDALEEKRKLKNTSYNILAELNQEELEKYRKEKKERLTKPDDTELRELIDTITSKTLAGEISKATGVDLLSDLMATNIMDKVEKPVKEVKKEVEETEIQQDQNELYETFENKEQEEQVKEEINIEIEENLSISKEILDKDQLEKMTKLEEEKEEINKELKDADPDFYTRSMDLSDKDFEMADDFKEKSLPLPIKIFFAILVIAVVAIAGFFIYKNI